MLRSTPSCTVFSRFLLVSVVAGAIAGSTVACGSDPVETPTEPTAVTVTETFSDTLNINGGRTTPFTATRAGTVTATLTALSPDNTVTIGLSLGTWNGSSCALIITNDAAKLNTSVVGTAQATGQYCARVYDVGRLTAGTDYTIDVTHY